MSGEPEQEQTSGAQTHAPGAREQVPPSREGPGGAEMWARHIPAARPNSDANRARSAHDHAEHGGHEGPHTDATLVTPGVTPGVEVNPAPVTGTGGATTGTPPAAPTAADTTAWLAAGNTWITGTLLPAMAAEPEGIGKNTAAYCQGTAITTGTPRVVLEAIVPTHDTDARVTASGQDPTQYKAWAWGSTANVSVNVNGLGGYHNGVRIGLVTRRDLAGGTFSMATVRTFLIHEVQHDSDHHESSREGSGERGGFDDAAWRWFKTEYRSYWLDTRFDALSPTTQHTATHPGINGGAVITGKNERSFACIKHLWDSGTAYQSIINAYNGNQRFKDVVHAHNGVDSANATNDPKVDDFVRAITAHQSSNAHNGWAAMNEAQRATCRGNGEIRRLIQAVWPVNDPYRVPLLGFIDYSFTDEDFRQAQRFCFALYHGNEDTMASEARGLGRAREWLISQPDFRRFAEHFTSFPNNGPGFCASWNASDVIALLNGSRQRGDFPVMAGCFASGTQVLMADGSTRAIETLEVGTAVLAYDEQARDVVSRRVTQRHDHPPEATFRATITGLATPVMVTAQHRFFVASRREWVRFGELAVGTELFHYDPVTREASPRHLERIEPADAVPVYNLSVEQDPSYFVFGILVHNTKMA
ncbi:MAG: Hint domain-containing protein [Kofleriaceae bacterium]